MKIIKFNSLTLFFLFSAFLCGYLKVALIISLIILIHELGHVFFIKIFKYSLKSITIYPFGGITKIEKEINTPIYKDLLISIGGVLFQLPLFFLPLNNLTKLILIKYNLAIMIFNMLPIIPLDGSIILNNILNIFFSYRTSYYIYLLISIISIILYLWGNYWFSLNNYLIISLFIYKSYEAFKNYPYLQNKFWLERYLNDYSFKNISTKKGDLAILKRETYQYFRSQEKIISEKSKLAQIFGKIN